MTVPLQFITVRDQDGELSFGRDDLVRYAGPSQIVASALTLRLLARAFVDLSPDVPPHRDDIHIVSAFPGQGVLDCCEMVTRGGTRNRLHVDLSIAPPEAPHSVAGQFYFEIRIGEQKRGYWLAEPFFTPEFLDQIVRHQDGTGTTTELQDYQRAKHALIGVLLGTPDEHLFHSRKI